MLNPVDKTKLSYLVAFNLGIERLKYSRTTCKRLPKMLSHGVRFRPHLYGLGYPRQPSPRSTLGEATLSLFLSNLQPTVYIRNPNSSRGARQLGWTSCLTSAGRVTLASGKTFLHVNALARLSGTALRVARVT